MILLLFLLVRPPPSFFPPSPRPFSPSPLSLAPSHFPTSITLRLQPPHFTPYVARLSPSLASQGLEPQASTIEAYLQPAIFI